MPSPEASDDDVRGVDCWLIDDHAFITNVWPHTPYTSKHPPTHRVFDLIPEAQAKRREAVANLIADILVAAYENTRVITATHEADAVLKALGLST